MAAVVALIGACVPAALAGVLNRLTSEAMVGGCESATNLSVPGIAIYTRVINVPNNANTVFVTMGTTGDQHCGTDQWFNANVDGLDCYPASGGASGTPAGWISLGAHVNYDGVTYNGGVAGGDGGGGSGDMHDNGIYYTWCCNAQPGLRAVQVRMASANNGGGDIVPGFPCELDIVFIEQAHFFIDSTFLGHHCIQNVPCEAEIEFP